MRIGELARATGVSVRSLRYYEEQGLLSAERTGGGHRTYGPDEVERVVFIQRMYAAGLSSRTIAAVMPCVETPSAAASDAALETLEAERARLVAHIEELERTRDHLDDLLACSRRHRAGLVPAPVPTAVPTAVAV